MVYIPQVSTVYEGCKPPEIKVASIISDEEILEIGIMQYVLQYCNIVNLYLRPGDFVRTVYPGKAIRFLLLNLLYILEQGSANFWGVRAAFTILRLSAGRKMSTS